MFLCFSLCLTTTISSRGNYYWYDTNILRKLWLSHSTHRWLRQLQRGQQRPLSSLWVAPSSAQTLSAFSLGLAFLPSFSFLPSQTKIPCTGSEQWQHQPQTPAQTVSIPAKKLRGCQWNLCGPESCLQRDGTCWGCQKPNGHLRFKQETSCSGAK